MGIHHSIHVQYNSIHFHHNKTMLLGYQLSLLFTIVTTSQAKGVTNKKWQKRIEQKIDGILGHVQTINENIGNIPTSVEEDCGKCLAGFAFSLPPTDLGVDTGGCGQFIVDDPLMALDCINDYIQNSTDALTFVVPCFKCGCYGISQYILAFPPDLQKLYKDYIKPNCTKVLKSPEPFTVTNKLQKTASVEVQFADSEKCPYKTFDLSETDMASVLNVDCGEVTVNALAFAQVCQDITASYPYPNFNVVSLGLSGPCAVVEATTTKKIN